MATARKRSRDVPILLSAEHTRQMLSHGNSGSQL